MRDLWTRSAKTCAKMLGLKFAYARNGHEIMGFDYLTGIERARSNLVNSRGFIPAPPALEKFPN
jgi:hypothetical protein